MANKPHRGALRRAAFVDAERWTVFQDRFAFTLFLSPHGAFGRLRADFCDFDACRRFTVSRLLPCRREDAPPETVLRFAGGDCSCLLRRADDRCALAGSLPPVRQGEALTWDITLRELTALPLPEARMPSLLRAQGRLFLDQDEYLFSPAAACGARLYETRLRQGAAGGVRQGHTLRFRFCGDAALLLRDGVCSSLPPLRRPAPAPSGQPFLLQSEDHSCVLRFSPFPLPRGLLSWGCYDGALTLPGGETVRLERMTGFLA